MIPRGLLPVSLRLRAMFGQYLHEDVAHPLRLNLGTARNHEDGFVSLDLSPDVGADVVHDLDVTPLPFASNTFDCVLASHVMEHVHHLVPLMRELHRVVKPGGHLIAITPYGSSDDAWENPFHVRCFTPMTWQYFDRRIYDVPGTAGNGDFGVDFLWRMVETRMVPYPEYADLNDTDLDTAVRKYRNVIRELQVVMRKETAA